MGEGAGKPEKFRLEGIESLENRSPLTLRPVELAGPFRLGCFGEHDERLWVLSGVSGFWECSGTSVFGPQARSKARQHSGKTPVQKDQYKDSELAFVFPLSHLLPLCYVVDQVQQLF